MTNIARAILGDRCGVRCAKVYFPQMQLSIKEVSAG